MKTVAVIQADLAVSPIGTDSRLTRELRGIPVLRRTIQRVCAANRLDHIVVTCPPQQYETVRGLLADTRVTVSKFEGPDNPARPAVRLARKWALHSWRGGMGGTCFFDEHTHPALCTEIARRLGAEAVLSVAAEAPLIDPRMIDEMVAHYERESAEARMVFAQSPPGLTPAVFSPALLEEASHNGLSPGWLNSYRPDQPQRDMVSLPNCFRPPLVVQATAGRLASDTRRGFELLDRVLGDAERDLTAEAVCRRLGELRRSELVGAPREIQIELTTEDQLDKTIMRPRGQIVEQRGPLELDILRRLVEDITAYDDVLVVLGGFGEPLLHPQFGEVLRICRQAGVFGLAIRTNGIALNEQVIRAVLEADVDVVHFLLDAVDPASYSRAHGCDAYETVTANITALDQARRERGKINPITIAGLTKSHETLDMMEAFYDRWLKHSGWAVIEGYSFHAGLVEDRRVMSMAPPQRELCRQLYDRCTVLADGAVVACDQDFQGRYVLGNLREQSLSEIRRSAPLLSLLEAHRQQRYSAGPMCQRCDEWHRP